jgi:O-antigen/teichoic acid export membrane protein
MRIRNSLKNILYGLSGQVISTIMGFVVRSVFIYTLGIEYLGLDGLFTGILIMLSLANLGFDTAMIYSLYKPLAENDTHKIQALTGRHCCIAVGPIANAVPASPYQWRNEHCQY